MPLPLHTLAELSIARANGAMKLALHAIVGLHGPNSKCIKAVWNQGDGYENTCSASTAVVLQRGLPFFMTDISRSSPPA